MLKPDNWIRKKSIEENMIYPFVEFLINKNEKESLVSYGLSSYGYDIRLDNKFKIPVDKTDLFRKEYDALNHTDIIIGRENYYLDPKKDNSKFFREEITESFIMPPHSFLLGCSVEYIKMPKNVTGILLCKSTYARIGLNINFTPIEAGWEGIITIELTNPTNYAVKVYANEGIGQLLFFESDSCDKSYADRNGKYLKQEGVTLNKI